MIYLDHNATTEPAAGVVAAMLNTMTRCWANASSQHGPGQESRRVLAAARATVARVLDMVKRAEYKRRQAPPGVRVSGRAFGRDWRYPITNGYRR